MGENKDPQQSSCCSTPTVSLTSWAACPVTDLLPPSPKPDWALQRDGSERLRHCIEVTQQLRDETRGELEMKF